MRWYLINYVHRFSQNTFFDNLNGKIIAIDETLQSLSIDQKIEFMENKSFGIFINDFKSFHV